LSQSSPEDNVPVAAEAPVEEVVAPVVVEEAPVVVEDTPVVVEDTPVVVDSDRPARRKKK
jgi:hypothetical protein